MDNHNFCNLLDIIGQFSFLIEHLHSTIEAMIDYANQNDFFFEDNIYASSTYLDNCTACALEWLEMARDMAKELKSWRHDLCIVDSKSLGVLPTRKVLFEIFEEAHGTEEEIKEMMSEVLLYEDNEEYKRR